MSVDFSQLYALPYDRGLSFSEREFFLSMFGTESRKRISLLHNSADQDRSLLGEYLCKSLLASMLGKEIEMIQFTRSNMGKPFLADSSEIHFNISHSDNWVICAISDLPIGVDIELIRGFSHEILENVLSPLELAHYHSTPYGQREKLFFTYWAAKESYLKALGLGLNVPLKSIEFQSSNAQWAHTYDHRNPNTSILELDSCYTCAVTVLGGEPPCSIINVNEMALV